MQVADRKWKINTKNMQQTQLFHAESTVHRKRIKQNNYLMITTVQQLSFIFQQLAINVMFKYRLMWNFVLLSPINLEIQYIESGRSPLSLS